MLILFLRAMLLYCFILVILRMTGKRQVSDLEPYDLLITMSIADLAFDRESWMTLAASQD